MRLFLRRLRGALGNAVTWGLSWFAGAWAGLGGMYLLGWLPSTYTWSIAFWIATNIGVTGLVTGGAFSAFLRFAYSDRSLLKIKVIRFSSGGAVVAAVCSPALTLIARSGLGMGLPGDLVTGALVAALFGGVTAGTTIKLAQHATHRIAPDETAALDAEQQEALALLEG